MFPIALAVLAILLGGAGLYFGISASRQLAPISENVTAGSDSAARLEAQIGELETRVAELSAGLEDLKGSFSRSRIYAGQTEQAIKKLATELNANREQITTLGEKLGELATRGQRAPAPAAAEPSAEAASGGDSSGGEGSVYRIKSGDTFARIAADQGVGLQALLDANPDADPRRLRIGQEIRIPSN